MKKMDDTLLLIEPGVAKAYEEANRPKSLEHAVDDAGKCTTGEAGPITFQPGSLTSRETSTEPVQPVVPKAKSFHGMAEIPAATAKMRLLQVAEEIISVLAADPNAEIKVRVEIEADFLNGASDQVKRTVSENARALGLRNAEWE